MECARFSAAVVLMPVAYDHARSGPNPERR